MRKLLLGAGALLAFAPTATAPAIAGGGDRTHVPHARHVAAHKHDCRCHRPHSRVYHRAASRAYVSGYYGWVAEPVTRVYYVSRTVYRPIYAYSAWSYPHQGYYCWPAHHRAYGWHHRHW